MNILTSKLGFKILILVSERNVRNMESPIIYKTSECKVFIHAFNKSGRHLEFPMNDVIRGKIIHVAKMATKDESSVDVDFAVCSCKKDCFYFISRGIFSLYNVFMGILS